MLYQEHGWISEQTGESGFIDLVLENQHQTVLLNVECKRPTEATWQFLVPRAANSSTSRCRYWASYLSRSQTKYFDWVDQDLTPPSYESAFCVVAGQDPKSRPMLERVASTVVVSTEALAREEAQLLALADYERLRVYINVIATTAKLEVCKFDATSIDLESGTMSDGEFEGVPFVRFRKQLSALQSNHETLQPYNFSDMARAKEDTVVVVHATELCNLLNELQIDRSIGWLVNGRR